MTKPIVLSLGELLWDMLPSGKRAGGAPRQLRLPREDERRRRLVNQRVGEDALGDELLAEAEKAASTPSSSATHGPPPLSRSA